MTPEHEPIDTSVEAPNGPSELLQDAHDQLAAIREFIAREHPELGQSQATSAVDSLIVETAEDRIERSDNPAQIDEALTLTIVEGVEEGAAVESNPVRSLTVDGFGPEVDRGIETLAYGTSASAESLVVAEAAARLVMELESSDVMGGASHGVEYVDSIETDSIDMRELLAKNEALLDDNELIRPSFTINGREVVFRNRQEMPTFADAPVAVLAGDAAPLSLPQFDIGSGGYKDSDPGAVEAYNRAHETAELPPDGTRLVISNTPESIAIAARELTPQPSARVDALLRQMQAGNYTDPGVVDYVDQLVACTAGEPTESGAAGLYDTDGFALVLASLSGNEQAARLVAAKTRRFSESYESSRRRRAEKNRSFSERRQVENRALNAQLGYERVPTEPIPLEQMALVHSTAHAIEHDADGNVVLFPAAAKRADQFPRSSLHFTLNSQVASNNGGTWETANDLVVANLKRSMDASHKEPYSLDGMDTWFECNPGEHLTLPDAIIVHGRGEGALLSETPGESSYLSKETYTEEEKAAVASLTERYLGQDPRYANKPPEELLKEIALKQALLRAGVPYEYQDVPSSDGHGMTDASLSERVRLAAGLNGYSTGKHFETAEWVREKECNAMSNGYYTEKVSDTFGWTYHPGVPIEMQRQILVSGYLPSRPPTYEASRVPDAPFGGVFF